MKKTLAVLFLLLGFSLMSRAQQIPTGSWRTHLVYLNPQGILVAQPYLYAWAERGMFRYHLADREIEQLSKINGFTDFEVNAMIYIPEYQVLVIGYQNGQIDLLYQHRNIENVSDIYQSSIGGDKTIHHISRYGKYILLSCGFGVQVYDLEKKESSATYQSVLFQEVYSSAVYNNWVYAATPSGLFRAPLPNIGMTIPPNLWESVAPGKYEKMLLAHNQLYLSVDSTLKTFDGITLNNLMDKDDYRALVLENNEVYVTTDSGVYTINSLGNIQFEVLKDAAYSMKRDNKWWYGSRGYGVIINDMAGNLEYIFPSGPFSQNTGKMVSRGKELWVAGGFMLNQGGATYAPNGYYHFTDGTWDNSRSRRDPVLDTINDFHAVTYDPYSDDIWMAGLTQAIFRFRNNQIVETYTPANTPLQLSTPQMVSGLAFDKNKHLWVCNFSSPTPLLVRTNRGVWDSFSLGSVRHALELVIDNSNRKWIRFSKESGKNPGIVVFDDRNTPLDKSDDLGPKVLSSTGGEGGLPDNQVNCLAVDRNGQIWVGTEKGLCVFSSPGNILSSNPSDARKIVIGEGSNAGTLLGDESITAIYIDGGNRKWIAARSGLWLVSADSREILAHYNEENSPILSNSIQELGMVEATGELFISTDRGLISLRTDASGSEDLHGEVKVFPNPVRPDFEGQITISGLATDAYVKITDVAGNLIYETRANGGTAVWNGRNFDGRKASSGVYLVFSGNQDASDTFVTKIMIVR